MSVDGVQSTKTLKPGKYWLFKTQKTMFEVFGTADTRPVDLFANDKSSKYQTNNTDTPELFEVPSPPNQSNNPNYTCEENWVRKEFEKQLEALKLESKKSKGHLS